MSLLSVRITNRTMAQLVGETVLSTYEKFFFVLPQTCIM